VTNRDIKRAFFTPNDIIFLFLALCEREREIFFLVFILVFLFYPRAIT